MSCHIETSQAQVNCKSSKTTMNASTSQYKIKQNYGQTQHTSRARQNQVKQNKVKLSTSQNQVNQNQGQVNRSSRTSQYDHEL